MILKMQHLYGQSWLKGVCPLSSPVVALLSVLGYFVSGSANPYSVWLRLKPGLMPCKS